MKNLWLSALIMIGTVSAQASAMIGNDQGNGGDAVLVDERYFSFDLYEAGLEQAPYFRKVVLNPNVESAVNQALDPAIFPNKVLSAKLSELYADDPIITSFIVQTLKAYSWRLVNSPLKDINDDQDTVINPPQGLIQAAIRKEEMITIDNRVWRKMDEANKAALVLHEAFYALVVPKANTSGGNTTMAFRQESVLARKATSFIFSRDFEPTVKGWRWFKDLVRDVDAFNIPDQLLSFKLIENTAGIGLVGDHFKITLVKEEYGYLSYSPMMAWGFNEANVRSFCQRVSDEAGAGTKHYITFEPLKIQISSQVPYADPQTGKHRIGQYENKWAGLAVSSAIIVNGETCVKYLLGFKPGVPLASR